MGDALQIDEELIPAGRKNRPGGGLKPGFITIHNTDNPRRGADARAHSKFVRETGYYVHNGRKIYVSWHFSVDDRRVIQHLPLNEVAYHAGSEANARSIAIEICMNAGIDQEAANRRAALLVAHLLARLRLDADRIRQHKDWTGKRCPSLLMGPKWDAFLAQVEKYRTSSGAAASLFIEAGETETPASPDAVDDVADFDIDHHLLTAALADASSDEGAALQLSDALADLTVRLEGLRDRAGRDAGGLPWLFPGGINEIALTIGGGEASVTVKGPPAVGPVGETGGALETAYDSVPESLDAAPPETEFLHEPALAEPVTSELDLPSDSLYATRPGSANHYGTALTIRAIMAAAALFHRATGQRVGVGDISKRGGGRLSGHVSHRKGIDVDIRLQRADGLERPVDFRSSDYSRVLTQQLVDAFRKNGAVPVELIFFNDPGIRGVQPYRGHDDHLHVRFRVI